MQPKTITDRNEYDALIESAMELQERARKNHGLTLAIPECINICIKLTDANAICEISASLDELLHLAQDRQ